MAQHGYLREYDEGWDRDYDRDDRRERSDRDWRSSNEDRGGRGMMFRGDRDRDDDRGFFDRARDLFGDEDKNRSGSSRQRGWDREDRSAWEGNRDWPQRSRGTSQYGREHGYGGFQGDFSRSGRQQGGFGGQGDYQGARSNFSGSSQDDHYRSWRDRQMQALDRDYQDYCREREQQFHSDFDSWRRNRQGQGGQSGSQDQGSLELAAADRVGFGSGASTDATNEPQATVDPDSAAMVGEATEKGNRRR